MVSSAASNVEEYLAELPGERAEVVEQVRELVLANLPDGVVETMNWGMIAYEIPLTRYPDTYNGQPLLYAALAAQKHHYALYLHSVYSSEADARRLQLAYDEAGVKLDVGRSCVRFKRTGSAPPRGDRRSGRGGHGGGVHQPLRSSAALTVTDGPPPSDRSA